MPEFLPAYSSTDPRVTVWPAVDLKDDIGSLTYNETYRQLWSQTKGLFNMSRATHAVFDPSAFTSNELSVPLLSFASEIARILGRSELRIGDVNGSKILGISSRYGSADALDATGGRLPARLEGFKNDENTRHLNPGVDVGRGRALQTTALSHQIYSELSPRVLQRVVAVNLVIPIPEPHLWASLFNVK